jgi:hypothetical protein
VSRTLTGCSFWATPGSRGTEAPSTVTTGSRGTRPSRGTDQGPREDPQCYPKLAVFEPCLELSPKGLERPQTGHRALCNSVEASSCGLHVKGVGSWGRLRGTINHNCPYDMNLGSGAWFWHGRCEAKGSPPGEDSCEPKDAWGLTYCDLAEPLFWHALTLEQNEKGQASADRSTGATLGRTVQDIINEPQRNDSDRGG